MPLRFPFFSGLSILILALAALSGCDPQRESKVEFSFYHWKSSLSEDSLTTAYLDTLRVRKLYVRFFDVHWDQHHQRPYPESVLHLSDTSAQPYSSLEIIPTVYITNESMKHISKQGIEDLAQHLKGQIRHIHDEVFGVGSTPLNEIQLDCDWTATTRENFFALIDALRYRMPETRLSCTIRLHQFKYPEKTGIPPVDQGSLMCYNMGDLGDVDEPNSILNLDKSKQYLLPDTDYPIPLTVALALFSWGVQYRSDKPVQLINNVGRATLREHEKFSEVSDNHFEVLESTFLRGTYVYAGDVIRTEQVTLDDLQALMQLIRESLTEQPSEIIFYHLDTDILAQYPVRELEALR